MLGVVLKWGKWLFVATWLAIVVGVFFGDRILAFVFHDVPFMGVTFTPSAWRQAGQCATHPCALDSGCPRGGMVRDLQRNHLPLGTPRAVVEQQLGQGAVGHRANCVVYPLGMCSGLGIDMDFLSVCYDDAHRLTSVGHHQS